MKFLQCVAVASMGVSVLADSGFPFALPQAVLKLLPDYGRGGSGSGSGSIDKSAKETQPNIVFVISDDQDLALGSTEYMPRIRRHLQDKGTLFRNHFVTTALCCPSRVSLWTGRQAHNTNVTSVKPPYGIVEPGCGDCGTRLIC